MKTLNHPNIVKLYDSVENENEVLMIYEFCD